MDGPASDTIEQETLVFELTPACQPRPANSSGRVSWKLSRVGRGFNAARMSTRHDFVFAAPHPIMRDSHNSISDFPADEIAEIARIPRLFDFAWSGP
jgi:hypothetical protein